MIKYITNNNLDKKASSWKVTFLGKEEENGWSRKIGLLFLDKNCVDNPSEEWGDVFEMAKGFFMSECDIPKVILEFIDNGSKMEMQFNQKHYSFDGVKTYKLVNFNLN